MHRSAWRAWVTAVDRQGNTILPDLEDALIPRFALDPVRICQLLPAPASTCQLLPAPVSSCQLLPAPASRPVLRQNSSSALPADTRQPVAIRWVPCRKPSRISPVVARHLAGSCPASRRHPLAPRGAGVLRGSTALLAPACARWGGVAPTVSDRPAHHQPANRNRPRNVGPPAHHTISGVPGRKLQDTAAQTFLSPAPNQPGARSEGQRHRAQESSSSSFCKTA